MHRSCEPGLVRHTVECVGHQHAIYGLGNMLIERHSIGAQPLADGCALSGNLRLSLLKYCAIKIQGNHLALDQPCKRRREVAIAAAQIEDVHLWRDANRP